MTPRRQPPRNRGEGTVSAKALWQREALLFILSVTIHIRQGNRDSFTTLVRSLLSEPMSVITAVSSSRACLCILYVHRNTAWEGERVGSHHIYFSAVLKFHSLYRDDLSLSVPVTRIHFLKFTLTFHSMNIYKPPTKSQTQDTEINKMQTLLSKSLHPRGGSQTSN